MIKRTQTLLDTITEKATATFQGPLPVRFGMEFSRWEAHWVKTAEDWLAELRTEGLTETANKVHELIEWQKKHAIGRFKNA